MKNWIRKWLGIDHLVTEKNIITKDEVIKVVREELRQESSREIYDKISSATWEFLMNEEFVKKVIKRINELQLDK